MSIKKTLLKACGAGGGGCDDEAFWLSQSDGTGSGYGVAFGVTVDSDCNVINVGYLSDSSGTMAYIQKHTSSGDLEWTKYSSQGYVFYCAVTDSANNIYAAGTSGSSSSLFIAKLNKDGVKQWVKSYSVGDGGIFDGSGQGTPSIAIDSSGNIVFCGSPYYATGVTSANLSLCVLKINSSGTYQWHDHIYHSSQDVKGTGLAIDSSDNVYVSGIDGNSGGHLIAKYNSSGTLQWKKDVKSNVVSEGGGLAVDDSGYVYAIGRNYISSTYKYDVYVLKIDGNGTQQWCTKLQKGNHQDCKSAIDLDSDGNVYIGTFENTSPYPGMYVKLNSSGTYQWGRDINYASSGSDVKGLVVDGSDSLIFCGYGWGSTPYVTYVAKVRNDGTTSGTYGSWSLSSASFSGTSYSPTISTSSISNSTAHTVTTTDDTSSVTFSDASITETSYDIS